MRRIAGTPTAQTWDPAGRVATAEWTVDDSVGASGVNTEVVVPLSWYSHGYRIIVTGGDIVSGADHAAEGGRRGLDRIQIQAHSNRPSENNSTGAMKVSVRIEPL